MSRRGGVVVAFVLTLVGAPAAAQVPARIDYQGLLTQSDGTAKPDGTYDLTFRLFGTASGGAVLWTELQRVTTDKGAFAVRLGSVIALPTSFTEDRWLSVQVGTEAELPRTRLLPTPYAVGARGIGPGGVTGAAIRPNSIQATDIAADAVGSADLVTRSLDYHDFDGRSAVVDLDCSGVLECNGEPCNNNSGAPDPEQRLCHGSINGVPARTWAIVFATASIELGCSGTTDGSGALMASRMEVHHQGAVADTAHVSAQVVRRTPGFGGEMTLATPITLQPGSNSLQVMSFWSGVGCSAYNRDFSAKWTRRRAHVLVLGRAP